MKKQWAHNGEGKQIMPCGATMEKLPAGVYMPHVVETMFGVQSWLDSHMLVTDALVVLDDSPVKHVTESIEKFQASDKLFKRHGIVHKRGVLFEGPPGTGKTSLANLVSKWFVDQGGIVLIANADNFQGVLIAIKNVREIQDTPLLVVMEDLDQFMEYGHTDVLMRLLDGQESVENIVYLATTNYLNKIDVRFTKRPSRFDEIVTVHVPSDAARRSYLSRLLDEFGAAESLSTYVQKSEGLLLAHLRELVIATQVLGQDLDVTVARLREMLPDPDMGRKKKKKNAAVARHYAQRALDLMDEEE